MTFWDRAYSESKLTFIDLIKGIIPCKLMFETKRKRKSLKITLKKVKENHNEEEWFRKFMIEYLFWNKYAGFYSFS
ncbi:hypothetical protein RhiirA1_473066 [Rhizophagus irregularis]|uniref:Uncharacterized protein n=1 Tax=Rhizophagus irregularis TaxID=588596 RepID=A0A2I1FJB5_9GLOM|nr:hypothetical protein RhiirA1_473066 [Rhizophagus irregularis]PKY34464.1 hypothetical protein RhiirB3_454190 [Rhizophagus irregularis]